MKILQAADRKPNILVIVADDLGFGELGVQGNPQIPTQHIDSIAANGVRFTNGYVSGPSGFWVEPTIISTWPATRTIPS